MITRPNRGLCMSLPKAALAAVLLALAATVAHGQTQRFCEGELGQADWACDVFTAISPEVVDVEFMPLPGSPDPDNPAMYQQIAGDPAFDDVTGLRNDNSAVFVLTEGAYFCTVAESNGEAVLIDAPEGSFTSSTTKYPTSSWLPESVGALLAEGTKLKYIVYTHSHWDHVGGAALVADYFAADKPLAISSRRSRWTLKGKDKQNPNTALGNTRGVPIPEAYEESVLEVGGLQFSVEKGHIHETGDFLIHLHKNNKANAEEGIATSVLIVTDGIFAGWSPFFSMAITESVQGYLEGLQQVNEFDFDVLVGGHLTRLGTKEDVQIKIDFFADMLAGAELGFESVAFADAAVGTGVFDPTNPNTGNLWLLFNEYQDRIVEVCYDYVLDSKARGRDWASDLAGLEITLRSHCWMMQEFLQVG